MIREIYYQFKILWSYAKNSSAYRKLDKSKRTQRQNFKLLVAKFSTKYETIKSYDDKGTTIELWRKFNEKLCNDFLPTPNFNFLRNPLILRTMFVSKGGIWLKKQLIYLEASLSEATLKKVLNEDLVGNPILIDSKYTTSHNSINHLYHILKLLNTTQSKLVDINTIVEWGGGYGNMTKIFKRLSSKRITYIVIDTPLFCSIQWLYLGTVFGENQVHLINQLPIKIIPNKINILPVGLAKNLNVKADLFISTWALSESSVIAQDLVIDKKWFRAKKILLGFQTSSKKIPYANNLANEIKKIGGLIEQIDFLPGNFYAFLNRD